MLRGYLELLRNAATIDELQEVGKDIALYLDTVLPADRDTKREALLREFKRNKAIIKVEGHRDIDDPDTPDEQLEELQIEGGAVDMRSLYGGMVRVMVPAWLASRRDVPSDMTGYIVHRTDKAVLFRAEMGTFNWEGWLPLSQVRIVQAEEQQAQRGRFHRQDMVTPGVAGDRPRPNIDMRINIDPEALQRFQEQMANVGRNMEAALRPAIQQTARRMGRTAQQLIEAARINPRTVTPSQLDRMAAEQASDHPEGSVGAEISGVAARLQQLEAELTGAIPNDHLADALRYMQASMTDRREAEAFQRMVRGEWPINQNSQPPVHPNSRCVTNFTGDGSPEDNQARIDHALAVCREPYETVDRLDFGTSVVQTRDGRERRTPPRWAEPRLVIRETIPAEIAYSNMRGLDVGGDSAVMVVAMIDGREWRSVHIDRRGNSIDEDRALRMAVQQMTADYPIYSEGTPLATRRVQLFEEMRRLLNEGQLKILRPRQIEESYSLAGSSGVAVEWVEVPRPLDEPPPRREFQPVFGEPNGLPEKPV